MTKQKQLTDVPSPSMKILKLLELASTDAIGANAIQLFDTITVCVRNNRIQDFSAQKEFDIDKRSYL